MSNELTTIPPLTESQKGAWLGMAVKKNEVLSQLKMMQLQAQSILLCAKESTDHVVIDKAQKEYRAAFTALQEVRKGFTNKINMGIIEPLMAFEKAMDIKINEDYLYLSTTSLVLRQNEAAKAKAANDRLNEIAAFKLHIDNDNYRRAMEYRNIIQKNILLQYSIQLRENNKEGWDVIKQMFKNIDLPLSEKFEAKILTKDELLKIFEGAKKVNFENIYNEKMIDFDNIFSNFDSDIAQSEAAIKHHQVLDDLRVNNEIEAHNINNAISSLIAKADTIQIEPPKIKTIKEVEVVQNLAWVAAVTINFNFYKPNVNVKKLESLTVGQMAVALGKLATETGCSFKGLILNEIQK